MFRQYPEAVQNVMYLTENDYFRAKIPSNSIQSAI